jgi:hypothetical protein
MEKRVSLGAPTGPKSHARYVICDLACLLSYCESYSSASTVTVGQIPGCKRDVDADP